MRLELGRRDSGGDLGLGRCLGGDLDLKDFGLSIFLGVLLLFLRGDGDRGIGGGDFGRSIGDFGRGLRVKDRDLERLRLSLLPPP